MVFTLRHSFDFINDNFDSGLVNVNSFEISGIISYNGYQYVVLDTDTAEIEIIARTWFDQRRSFDYAVNVLPGGTKTFEFSPRGDRPAHPEEHAKCLRPPCLPPPAPS